MRVTVNLILILAAVVFGVLVALGFWWDWSLEHTGPLLGAAVACLAASLVPWGARGPSAG